MSGNGVDLGAIYQLLSQVAETVARQDRMLANIERTMATKSEIGGLKSELMGLRQTVTHYHSSVVGHGILISDLEAGVRRVEEHLDLPSA